MAYYKYLEAHKQKIHSTLEVRRQEVMPAAKGLRLNHVKFLDFQDRGVTDDLQGLWFGLIRDTSAHDHQACLRVKP